jgi:hypothetical protein
MKEVDSTDLRSKSSSDAATTHKEDQIKQMSEGNNKTLRIEVPIDEKVQK